MVIEEADFKMESDNRGRFDLFFRNNTNTNWKLYGYSMTLKNCIQAISHERLSQKLDVTDLKTFIKELKSIHNEVVNLLSIINE
jgi:hypothetical protein